MTLTDAARLAAMEGQRERLALAVSEFHKGDKGQDIQHILLEEEFREVRTAANLAAENKLASMLRGVKAQLKGEGVTD